MADLRSANFEAGTLDNEIATSDPGSESAWDTVDKTNSGSIAYDDDQKYGTLAAHFTTGSGSTSRAALGWTVTLPAFTPHYGRFYIYPVANWLADNYLIVPLRSGSSQGIVSVGADNKIALWNIAQIKQVTSTNGLTQNSWNRVEWRFIHDNIPNGEIEARLFLGTNADGTTPDETVSVTGIDTHGAGAPLEIRFGQNTAQTVRSFYLDNIVINTTGWPGPALTAGQIFKRFYGPAQLPGSAADLYTVPAGARARILGIHVSNPSASSVDLNLSIGTDAAGTRVYDGFSIAADSTKTNFDPYDLAAGEKIQGFASSAGTIVLTITGYEQPA